MRPAHRKNTSSRRFFEKSSISYYSLVTVETISSDCDETPSCPQRRACDYRVQPPLAARRRVCVGAVPPACRTACHLAGIPVAVRRLVACPDRANSRRPEQPPRKRKSLLGSNGLKEAEEVLRHGELVGVAPEGHLGKPGQMSRLNPGVFRLALTTGAPIIPVGIQGSHRVMDDLKGLPRPFRRVRLTYGNPSKWKDPANRQWLRETLMQRLAELSNQQPYTSNNSSMADASH